MLNDIELLKEIRAGDVESEEKLLTKYKPLVSAIARKYYLIGGEREDLLQEGWMGFFGAMRKFDVERGENFQQFATILIEREMIDAIRRANSGKNQVLSSSVFVDNDDILSSDFTLEDNVVYQETYQQILAEIKSNLSKRELIVLEKYLQGYTYVDIAENLGVKPKSVDNTLTRIKNKLKGLKDKL